MRAYITNLGNTGEDPRWSGLQPGDGMPQSWAEKQAFPGLEKGLVRGRLAWQARGRRGYIRGSDFAAFHTRPRELHEHLNSRSSLALMRIKAAG